MSGLPPIISTLQILKVSAKVSLRFTVVSWGLLHVENLSCTCRGFGWGFLVEGFPKKPFIDKRGYTDEIEI